MSDGCSLAIIGDGSVGKSSIIAAFRDEGFLKVYRQTVGCDFYEKSLQIRGELRVSLRVWDIGGQSIHSKNLDKYIGNSTAIFLVYDVTNGESFRNLDDWLHKVRLFSKAKTVFVIGNKVDLLGLRQVTESMHEDFIRENQLQGGLFLSAKTGDNVVKSFYAIAAEAVGVKLTAYELACHNKVLTAYITKDADGDSDAAEGRTAFADEIEREDMEAERRKKQQEEAQCRCILS